MKYFTIEIGRKKRNKRLRSSLTAFSGTRISTFFALFGPEFGTFRGFGQFREFRHFFVNSGEFRRNIWRILGPWRILGIPVSCTAFRQKAQKPHFLPLLALLALFVFFTHFRDHSYDQKSCQLLPHKIGISMSTNPDNSTHSA